MANNISITWQQVEKLVRAVAQAKFGAIARAEDIAGVKCDCVLHIGDGSVVLIEISKDSSLRKLRTDVAKFNVLRTHFLQQNIFPRCYFITTEDPKPSIINSAKANYVNALSIGQFLNTMLGVSDYTNLRLAKAFGSAVDLYSGEPDKSAYVDVKYYADTGVSYGVSDIATELISGRTIVLIGDYGSGKSRCIAELFAILAKTHTEHYRNPIAINLRENWGLKRASEIITRHFTDMGLKSQVDDVVKVAYSKATIYLLDGFDEIGAQTWSDDPTKLTEIRKRSLVGVNDLISHAQGGVIIAGRDHYFNDDAELMTCLGLDKKSPLVLRCHQELSNEQFAEMLGRSLPNLPTWVPKKPLIARLIRDIEPEVLNGLFENSNGQMDFWSLLVESFCEREALINPILDAAVIRMLYTKIGRLARFTKTTVGPISIKQLNSAFEETTGRPPTDESAIILQRLPGLSRVGAESLDRQFVDEYILDGLKAEDVLTIYGNAGGEEIIDRWRNPVDVFGALYIATRLTSTNQLAGCMAFIRRLHDASNRVLLSDLMAALFLVESDVLDFGGFAFTGGCFTHISFAGSKVSNLSIEDATFGNLDLTDAEPDNVSVSGSVIIRLAGVASADNLPSYVSSSLVESYQNMKTLSAIRKGGLSVSQTFLLSSLRKLFLQPGGARKESSMYKGFGDIGSKRECRRVMAILVRNGFCQKLKGATEPIYVPDRSKTGRVMAMMSQLTTSKDLIWTLASRPRK